MTTITIPKSEYSKIIKTQEELKGKVDWLQRALQDAVRDELRPEYAKKLDHISASLDKGKGKRFLDKKSAKQYLKNL